MADSIVCGLDFGCDNILWVLQKFDLDDIGKVRRCLSVIKRSLRGYIAQTFESTPLVCSTIDGPQVSKATQLK